MNKKMANKILAAVLSLGAVMSNGSVSSARENSTSKSSEKISGRTGWAFGKQILDFTLKKFDLKDLLYLFVMMKIHNSTRREDWNQGLDFALKYLTDEYKSKFLARTSKDYLGFYGAEDTLYRFTKSCNNTHLTSSVRDRLIDMQISRLNNLLFVKDENNNNKNNNNNNNNKSSDEMLMVENNNSDDDNNEVGLDPLLKNNEFATHFWPLGYFNEELNFNCLSVTKDSVTKDLDISLLYEMRDCLLDDLNYLFKFTDKEITDYFSKQSTDVMRVVLVCFRKLNTLTDAFSKDPDEMNLRFGNDKSVIKTWKRYVARIQKLNTTLDVVASKLEEEKKEIIKDKSSSS